MIFSGNYPLFQEGTHLVINLLYKILIPPPLSLFFIYAWPGTFAFEMQGSNTYRLYSRLRSSTQYIFSIAAVAVVAALGYGLSGFTGYRVVALLLLVTVSLIAMFLSIGPVMVAALLSALVWNYFFIPPRFTFQVGNTEDALLLAMYFVITLVHAVLTYKIRQMEKHAREKEERERTIELYNTLINSLSHELRTPIAAILAATDNLQQDGRKLSETNKAALIEEISIASLRLNQQVENLLNISRLESGFIQPRKDWCDMNELVHDVINKLGTTLAGHKLVINIPETLPLCRLDRGLTEQIIRNLVQNAAQHSYSGTSITISVVVSPYKDECTIYVSDNGIGFPAEETEKVFNKFYRLGNARPGGTGLGLSIVKGFTEAQQGRVTLSNTASGGAEFAVTIPVELSYLNTLKNE